MLNGAVPAVLDLLKVLGALHLGVKQTVFMDVLLLLDLMRIAQLGDRLLMFLVEPFHSGAVISLGKDLFFLAAGGHRLIIIGLEMGLEVIFRLCDQFVDLALVLGLHRLSLLQFLAQSLDLLVFFLRGVDPVTL